MEIPTQQSMMERMHGVNQCLSMDIVSMSQLKVESRIVFELTTISILKTQFRVACGSMIGEM